MSQGNQIRPNLDFEYRNQQKFPPISKILHKKNLKKNSGEEIRSLAEDHLRNKLSGPDGCLIVLHKEKTMTLELISFYQSCL